MFLSVGLILRPSICKQHAYTYTAINLQPTLVSPTAHINNVDMFVYVCECMCMYVLAWTCHIMIQHRLTTHLYITLNVHYHYSKGTGKSIVRALVVIAVVMICMLIGGSTVTIRDNQLNKLSRTQSGSELVYIWQNSYNSQSIHQQ